MILRTAFQEKFIVTEDYDATMSKQHVKQCFYTSKCIHSQINARTHEKKE
jgi:hypothetical protein